MITKQTIIRNKTGLHARPASDFAAKAKTFGCAVKVRNLNTGRPPVNAKSVILLLSESMSQRGPGLKSLQRARMRRWRWTS